MNTTPKQRPRAGILYTGGTFGMVPSPRGYEPSTDLPARVEAQVAGLDAAGMPEIEWLTHAAGPPVNSSDIRPRFWYDIADAIREHAGRLDGFVVIHGTDTLANTGAALSFLLADVECPVVVTGASKPLGEEGSDAADNLRAALRICAAGRPTEVSLAFGSDLLRANRASKRYGEPGRLFDSPHVDPLARLDDDGIQLLDPDSLPVVDHLPAPAWRDVPIALLPVHPGLSASQVQAICDSGIEALVLEAYPAGVGPGNDPDFVAAIADAVDRGIVVAAVCQSRSGRIRLGRYAASTPLAEASVISGADMTREAALAKLHYLLAAGVSPRNAGELFGSNLRGELTPDENV